MQCLHGISHTVGYFELEPQWASAVDHMECLKILQVWQTINISGSRPHEYGCFTGADAPWHHGFTFVFTLEPGSWKHQENLTGDDAADWKRLPFPWLVCNPSAAWPGSVANGNLQSFLGLHKPCIAGALMALRPLKIEVNESYEFTVTTISFYLPSGRWLSPQIGIDNSEEATSLRPNLWTHFQESCGIFGSMVQLPNLGWFHRQQPIDLASPRPGSQHESMAWTKRTLVPMRQGPCRASLRMWRRGPWRILEMGGWLVYFGDVWGNVRSR